MFDCIITMLVMLLFVPSVMTCCYMPLMVVTVMLRRWLRSHLVGDYRCTHYTRCPLPRYVTGAPLPVTRVLQIVALYLAGAVTLDCARYVVAMLTALRYDVMLHLIRDGVLFTHLHLVLMTLFPDCLMPIYGVTLFPDLVVFHPGVVDVIYLFDVRHTTPVVVLI